MLGDSAATSSSRRIWSRSAARWPRRGGVCLLCTNSDVQRRRQHGRDSAAGSLADHAVEHVDDVSALLVGEIGHEHAGDRVATEAPVLQLLSGPHGDALLVARLDDDIPQACLDQPLP